MDERLQPIITTLKNIRAMIPDTNYSIALYDKDCCLQFFDDAPGATREISIGDKFNDPTGMINKALASGKPLSNKLPESKVGHSRTGTLVPGYF